MQRLVFMKLQRYEDRGVAAVLIPDGVGQTVKTASFIVMLFRNL